MKVVFLRWLMPLVALSNAAAISAAPTGGSKRVMEIEDFDRVLAVDDVVCASDGGWVAYTVEGADLQADERKSSIWMVNFEGTQDIRLSAAGESASKPEFSPDGRYVSFLSARKADLKPQIYLLDRRGGEAQPITEVTGEISDYAWSPDGGRLVVSMSAGEAASDKIKTPKPIVIDRLHFKQDVEGYLTATDRNQLSLINVSTKQVASLTADPGYDDTLPVWSPDGRTIAFFSDRGMNEGRSGRLALYLIDVRSGAEPRKLTEFFTPNRPSLSWTHDGTRLVFTSGVEPRLNAYIQDRLTVVAVADGKVKLSTERLDRALASAAVAADDLAVHAILEDDGTALPVTVRLDTGSIGRPLAGKFSTKSLCAGGGHIAVVASTDSTIPEVYALEAAGLRKLTGHNDGLLNELRLGTVEDISFPSRDGTAIHGMLVKPVDYQPGKLYPTLLWIHGGPNGQDSHSLDVGVDSSELERQWFAAHGYVVLAVNYRGSSGRGGAFASSIASDWGNKEVADLLAAVDYAVREKLADPRRLGVGGWSYGGILTDYTIASDSRFKAAVSGAGSGNQLATYGSDEYVLQYNAELGPPWRNLDRWLRVSYPFFHADRIKTPTLFLGGDKDFNVPVAGGEQMYEALRTLGIAAQLVVYPGQNHILTRPSYIKDCVQRYLDWFDRYLKPPAH